MTAAPVPRETLPPPTLAGLAADVLRMFDGDTVAATNALNERLSRDVALLGAVVRAAVADAVAYRVQARVRAVRAQTIHHTTGDRGAVIALANGLRMGLLDTPIARGVRLRDATREEVMESCASYGAASATMAHRARWLQLIGQSVPSGRVVGDVMDDARALELYREAESHD